MKNFIEGDNGAEYIISGPLFSPEQEKLNIATGGEDIPELESEENAEKRQKQGLKIMTPKQMITRLPILLAQKKQVITVIN